MAYADPPIRGQLFDNIIQTAVWGYDEIRRKSNYSRASTLLLGKMFRILSRGARYHVLMDHAKPFKLEVLMGTMQEYSMRIAWTGNFRAIHLVGGVPRDATANFDREPLTIDTAPSRPIVHNRMFKYHDDFRFVFFYSSAEDMADRVRKFLIPRCASEADTGRLSQSVQRILPPPLQPVLAVARIENT